MGDVTDASPPEVALAGMEEILLRAVEAAPDGILVVDGDGRIVFTNPMLGALFGYEAHELFGQPVELLLPESLRAGHERHREQYVANPRARPMGSGLDLRGRRRSGEEFPVEISLSPLPVAGQRLVIAIVRDVTEHRKAAEELMEAHERLALAEDRERIARDLHDTVIQRLFAVGLSLQGALTRASEELAGRLQDAIDEIDATIRDIRSAIFALHTRRAPGQGVRDDVLAVVREAARALGFEPAVRFEGLIDSSVPPRVHEELVPTLREALSNVAKHAQASHVTVSLALEGDRLELRVADDGRGLTGGVTGGRGLANMTERAARLGGGCTVRRDPGGGTVLEWHVPLTRH